MWEVEAKTQQEIMSYNYIDGVGRIQSIFNRIWNIRRHTSEKMKPTTITVRLIVPRYFIKWPYGYISLIIETIIYGSIYKFADDKPIDRESRWAVFESSNSNCGLNWTHFYGLEIIQLIKCNFIKISKALPILIRDLISIDNYTKWDDHESFFR